MKTIEDGGPIAPTMRGNAGSIIPVGGLTIRDWFAGMALQGVYTAGVGDLTEAEIAADAYRMADSMITARAASEPA